MPTLPIPIRIDSEQAKKEVYAFTKELAQAIRRADSDAATSAKEAEKARVKSAKDEQQARAQINRELNQLVRDLTRDEARASREAAAEQQRQIKERARADKAAYQEAVGYAKAAERMQKYLAAEQARGTKAAAAGFDDMRLSLGNFIKASAGLSGFEALLGGIVDRSKQTADYMAQIGAEFKQLQAGLQQVSALSGKPNSNQFTVEQTQAAAAAGLTPQEWIKAQEGFLSTAGAYTGDLKDNPMSKLSTKDALLYQSKLATFSKGSGISPEEMMGLGGGLLQFSEGPQDVNKLLKRAGKTYQTLERAPGDVRGLLAPMSRIMSQGLSPEDAARNLTIAREAAPGEETTVLENALRAMRNELLEGRGGELGLKKGMTPAQMLEAGSRKLVERADKGEDIDELLKKYAPDDRERRGMISYINRGVRAQGFERTQGYLKDTPDGFIDERIAGYRSSDAGQRAQNDADLAVEQAKQAAKMAPVENLRERARVELTKEGRFSENSWTDWFRGGIGKLTGVNPAEQSVNERAFQIAQRQNGVVPNAYDGIPFVRSVAGNERVMGPAATQSEANSMILLELQKQTKILEGKMASPDKTSTPPAPIQIQLPTRPLSAPPPMPLTRIP